MQIISGIISGMVIKHLYLTFEGTNILDNHLFFHRSEETCEVGNLLVSTDGRTNSDLPKATQGSSWAWLWSDGGKIT